MVGINISKRLYVSRRSRVGRCGLLKGCDHANLKRLLTLTTGIACLAGGVVLWKAYFGRKSDKNKLSWSDDNSLTP